MQFIISKNKTGPIIKTTEQKVSSTRCTVSGHIRLRREMHRADSFIQPGAEQVEGTIFSSKVWPGVILGEFLPHPVGYFDPRSPDHFSVMAHFSAKI